MITIYMYVFIALVKCAVQLVNPKRRLNTNSTNFVSLWADPMLSIVHSILEGVI